MHSDRSGATDLERAALRLRLAAVALATTLVLLGGGAPSWIALALLGYAAFATAARYGLPRLPESFAPGAALATLGLDVAAVGALVAALPLDRPAWILFLFPTGLGALRYGVIGAAGVAAAAIVIVDIVIALRLPEVEALALWPLQLLVAAALVSAELVRVRGRDALDHDVLQRRSAALTDISAAATSAQVLRAGAEHVFRVPGVISAWCWVQREDGVAMEQSRGDVPAGMVTPAASDLPVRGRSASLERWDAAAAGTVIGVHNDPRAAIAATMSEGSMVAERRDALVRDIADATARALAAAIERERAERSVGELRIALESVRGQLKAKEEAVATAVHELRTPLTSVGGYAQIVSRHLESMQRQVAQLARLISDLQPMASPSATMTVGPVDVRDLVRGAVARARVLSDADVQLEEPATPVILTVDGPRIGQVIDNLLGNAVKYSTPPASVIVSLREEEDGVRMSVTDQGRGISPDDLPRLFDRGFRAADDVKGQGLGLSVVRDVVEAHGGKVGASSAGIGSGSTFWVVLPKAQPKEDVDNRAPTEVEPLTEDAARG